MELCCTITEPTTRPCQSKGRKDPDANQLQAVEIEVCKNNKIHQIKRQKGHLRKRTGK